MRIGGDRYGKWYFCIVCDCELVVVLYWDPFHQERRGEKWSYRVIKKPLRSRLHSLAEPWWMLLWIGWHLYFMSVTAWTKTVPLTLGIGKSNSKSLRLWLSLADICRSIPYPTSITANVGRKLHVRNNYRGISPLTYPSYIRSTYHSGWRRPSMSYLFA